MAIIFHNQPTLENIGQSLHTVIDWLAKQDSDIEAGELTIPNTNFTAIIIAMNPVEPIMTTFEAHQQMIDIHYCLAGSERILYTPAESLDAASKYDQDKDVTFYHAPADASSLFMTPGMIATLFPADAHLPFNPANDKFIKKIVAKLPVDQFSIK